jgi:hypothetical protein
MREAMRLAYLDALGVTNWIPRRPLARAAKRQPALLDLADLTDRPVAPSVLAGSDRAPSSARPVEVVREAVEAARAAVAVPREPTAPVIVSASESVALAAPAIDSFYLQLWQAGSCVLLLELDETGLATGSASQRLLSDILRAAELPTPRLLADFRWPLIRNQADRSALAASQGLHAFMEARLEGLSVSSIGCLGSMAALLAEGDIDQAKALCGREEALDGLPPAWIGPRLEELMAQPEAKARLWELLKRIKSRWKLAE